MIGKAFWLSKTFWVNVLAGVAIVAQALWGWVMDPEGNRIELWEPPAAPVG